MFENERIVLKFEHGCRQKKHERTEMTNKGVHAQE
jgi:hypothetical protein